MRRAVLLFTIGILAAAGGAGASPVELLETRSRIEVDRHGAATIAYELKFTDLEGGRSQIESLGPLRPTHEITRSSVFYETGRVNDRLPGVAYARVATLEPLGDDRYRVDLGFETERGQTYTLSVKCVTTLPILEHTEDRIVFLWSPPEWDLPVDLQSVDVVTHFELPAGTDRPEDVTREAVEAAGLTVEEATLRCYDEVGFYPVPDGDGTQYLGIQLTQKSAPPGAKAPVEFRVPTDGLRAFSDEQTGGGRLVHTPPPGSENRPSPGGLRLEAWQIVLTLAVYTALLLGVLRLWVLLRRRRLSGALSASCPPTGAEGRATWRENQTTRVADSVRLVDPGASPSPSVGPSVWTLVLRLVQALSMMTILSLALVIAFALGNRDGTRTALADVRGEGKVWERRFWEALGCLRHRGRH